MLAIPSYTPPAIILFSAPRGGLEIEHLRWVSPRAAIGDLQLTGEGAADFGRTEVLFSRFTDGRPTRLHMFGESQIVAVWRYASGAWHPVPSAG